jgi:hypothetical protein
MPGAGGKILTGEYNSTTGYWIPKTGVTGWLAFGNKDVYRINKASVDAEYIRVSAQPSFAGTNLVPELCIVASPVDASIDNLKNRCPDAASVRRIPNGDSYVVVFNDSENLTRYHGDVTQYRIEVGSGAGWDRCDDGIRNGQELAADCGGNCAGCAVGQPCRLPSDCKSFVCDYSAGKCAAPPAPAAPACTAETAVDLGAPGQVTAVPSDGCVKVEAGYPSWWGTRTMNLMNPSGGRYPIPFTWSNSCGNGTGEGTFTRDWQSTLLRPTSSACATVIDLRGDGSTNIALQYYGQ